MKPWERVRRALKAIGGSVVAAGGAAVTAGASMGRLDLVVGGLVALALGGPMTTLAIDLRRDRWTPEEVEAYRAKRRRTTTRTNPITGGKA